jgi:hypothetical protein
MLPWGLQAQDILPFQDFPYLRTQRAIQGYGVGVV